MPYDNESGGTPVLAVRHGVVVRVSAGVSSGSTSAATKRRPVVPLAFLTAVRLHARIGGDEPATDQPMLVVAARVGGLDRRDAARQRRCRPLQRECRHCYRS